MELIDALYARRSTRNFTEEPIDKKIIEALIEGATYAPSALNTQPWAFSVIQDKALLKQISDETKRYLLSILETSPYLEGYKTAFSNPDFNVFYNASTLLTIYSKPISPNPACDCTLAAQNIMLMAHDKNLGSCWIGFAQLFLNTPEMKEKLNIPKDYHIIAPLVLGYPAQKKNPPSKKKPEILFWK